MSVPAYAGSKSAFHISALPMMIEHENGGIKVNLAAPEFTGTALNNFHGETSLEDGAREVVRVAKIGPNAPSRGFTRGENQTIPV